MAVVVNKNRCFAGLEEKKYLGIKIICFNSF